MENEEIAQLVPTMSVKIGRTSTGMNYEIKASACKDKNQLDRKLQDAIDVTTEKTQIAYANIPTFSKEK